jgi:tetratricopeptide (TPR) repeat protein
MLLRIPVLGVFFAALLLGASVARAENEGQDDLDRATEKKLSADSIEDLTQVIDLCEGALKKGLDATNTQFAKNMLTGTLMQRATFKSQRLAQRRPRNWSSLRNEIFDDLNKALENDPKLAAAHILKVQLYILGDDLNPPKKKEALKSAEDALECSKDQIEEHVQALRLIATLTDSMEKRTEMLDRAIKLAPNNVGLLKDDAKHLLQVRQPEKAVEILDNGIKNDPEDPELRLLRGFALLMSKKTDDAVSAFGDAIRLAPDSPLPYLYRAQLYAQLKKNDEAIADISHALDLDGNNVQAILLRARVFAQDKKNDEALVDIRRALELDSNNLIAILLRAQVHQQKGDLDAARADVDEALKDRPGSTDALAMRAILAVGSGDYSQAISDFDKLAKIAPKNEQLQIQLGMLHALNKQPRKAIERYSEALAIKPNEFAALRGRADSYLNVGKHAEAIVDYEAALKLKPTDSGVLNNLAWVLATSPEDKVRDGKRSVELGSKAAKETEYKQAHILSTLAAGYAEAGDFDKAIEWSKKAVEVGSEDTETTSQLKKELTSYEEKKPWREKQIIEDKEDTSPDSGSSAGSSVQREPATGRDKDSSAAKQPPTRTE